MQNSDNPLTAVLLEFLAGRKEPSKLTELYSHCKPFLGRWLSDDPDLALFESNFLIMNALYQLQATLHEEGWYVMVSPVNIAITPLQEETGSSLSEHPDNELARYYLDWANFQTTTVEVNALLDDFWKAFAQHLKTNTSEPYEILGLPHTATFEEVKFAYRKLANEHHPDKGGTPETFTRIRLAYENLKYLHSK